MELMGQMPPHFLTSKKKSKKMEMVVGEKSGGEDDTGTSQSGDSRKHKKIVSKISLTDEEDVGFGALNEGGKMLADVEDGGARTEVMSTIRMQEMNNSETNEEETESGFEGEEMSDIMRDEGDVPDVGDDSVKEGDVIVANEVVGEGVSKTVDGGAYIVGGHGATTDEDIVEEEIAGRESYSLEDNEIPPSRVKVKKKKRDTEVDVMC